MRKKGFFVILLFTVLFPVASCAPHSPSLETTLSKEEKSGMTVSNVSLNDAGEKVAVRPGSIVRGTLDYQVWTEGECPSCIAQIVVGVGDTVQYCIYFGFPGTYPGASGKGEIRFTAPVVAGSYDVRYKRVKAFTCEHAKNLYVASPPTSANTIATIIVDSSLPEKKEPGVTAVTEEPEVTEETEEPQSADEEVQEVPGETMVAKVYFSNRKRARGKRCTAVFPVRREAPKSLAVATAAMNQLFLGPTEDERSQGYSSGFSEETAGLLRRITIKNKTAYVDLNDFRTSLSDVNTPCGRKQFLAQMTRTVTRFRTVKKAIFAIEGDPEAFYAFMKTPCDKKCDPEPFEEQ
jgi:hypothetical protein